VRLEFPLAAEKKGGGWRERPNKRGLETDTRRDGQEGTMENVRGKGNHLKTCIFRTRKNEKTKQNQTSGSVFTERWEVGLNRKLYYKVTTAKTP